MDLFEVVAVLNVRLTKLVAFISEGQDKEVPPAVLTEEEQVVLGWVLPMLSALSVFSTRVLAVAAPELPAFSQHLYAPVTGQNDLRPAALDHLILAYARAKEEFIASGLQPANECARKRAELAVHSGAWFGSAKQPTKARQIQVAEHQPGKSSDINDMVEEYGLPFVIQPLQEDPTATVRRTNALGSNAGPCYGPDTLHDCNHGDDCRQKYGGINSCVQLSGVNPDAHEQNHAKKEKFLHMLIVMKFDRLAFMVSLINETENEAINRKSMAHMVKHVRGHGSDRVEICQAQVWFCGRCFYQKSPMGSFDQFGRVRLTFVQS